MAIHTINLAEVTQGIADYVVRLGRALTSSELYEFIYDHIVEKYPNATMGEVQNLHRVVREAIAHQEQGKRFEQDRYSFQFKVDPETFKRMTADPDEEMYRKYVYGAWNEDPQPNYADYVAIPGLTGWSAPSSYNRYHGGNGAFKYCRPFNIKGRHWNVRQFDPIPFKFIPSSLIID